MQSSRWIVAAALSLSFVSPVVARAAEAKAPAPIRVDLSKEKAGEEPTRFLSVVGDWTVADEGGKKVLLVDGRTWKRGQPASGASSRRG